MAEARQRDSWERTSWMLAKLHNVNCARACDLITPDEVNPMHRGPRRPSGGTQEIDADYNSAMCDALKSRESQGGN